MPTPLLQQAGIYTLSNLVIRAFPFLLLPALTRYLSPADYGILAMFLLVVVVVEPFVNIGYAGAITVKFYDRSTDMAAFVGTGAQTVFGTAIPVAILLLLIRDPLSDITGVPPNWLLVVVPLVVARTISSALPALLRVREKAVAYAIFQVAQSLGIVTLTLILVVALGRSWPGRIEAEFLITLAMAIGGASLLWRSGWLRFVFVSRYARQLASFGVPLIPHVLGAVLLVQTNRLFITNMVGLDETGLYTVGYQLALVIELVAVSFNSAYTPWLYRRLTDADDAAKRSLVRYTYVQFAGMALLAATVAIVMPWAAGFLLGERFDGAEAFIGWFAVGFMFSGMYYMVTNYIFYVQRTKWLATVTMSVAIFNIPLCYVLILFEGAVGAAQAMAISLGLSFVLTWIVSQRVYPMPWLGSRGRAFRPGERP